LLAALALLLGPAASAQDSITLDAFNVLSGPGAGWHFEVELEVAGATSASFTPPGSSTATPIPEDLDFPGSFFFSDPLETAPGFTSLVALLASHPTGNYLVLVNGSALQKTVPFAPIAPDGIVTLTSPANGSSNVSQTPSVDFTQNCINCNFLSFDIESMGTGAFFDATASIPGPLPNSGPIAYTAFLQGGAAAPPLPNGSYDLFGDAAVGTLDPAATFDVGSGSFQLFVGAANETSSVFTVPEPRAGLAAGAALAALLALSVRRR